MSSRQCCVGPHLILFPYRTAEFKAKYMCDYCIKKKEQTIEGVPVVVHEAEPFLFAEEAERKRQQLLEKWQAREEEAEALPAESGGTLSDKVADNTDAAAPDKEKTADKDGLNPPDTAIEGGATTEMTRVVEGSADKVGGGLMEVEPDSDVVDAVATAPGGDVDMQARKDGDDVGVPPRGKNDEDDDDDDTVMIIDKEEGLRGPARAGVS
jgi:hypothetical protein